MSDPSIIGLESLLIHLLICPLKTGPVLGVRTTLRSHCVPPWTFAEILGGSVVQAASGARLAYLYVSTHVASAGLTRAKAKALAAAICMLSDKRD